MQASTSYEPLARPAPDHPIPGIGGKGKGKGGKGLPLPTPKRRKFRILRDSCTRMSKGSILRLARRGGVKRFGGEAYPETRAALSDYLKDVLSDSVSYAEHEKRRTVSALDVVHALQRSGINMYGFGC